MGITRGSPVLRTDTEIEPIPVKKNPILWFDLNGVATCDFIDATGIMHVVN